MAPVVAAAGLADADEVFRLGSFVLALVAAIAIQIAANFANDVSDATRGADTPERIGPPRMVAAGVITPGEMWIATWVAVGVAVVAAIGLLLVAGPVVIVIGVASVLAMLGYVGGPFPYGYRGLGEVFVFIFFGLVATVGARYVHDGSAPLSAWLAAIPIGFLAAAILVANNLRDIDTDAGAGKRTLAVIIGPERTRILYGILVVSAFALVGVFAIADRIPRGAIVAVPFVMAAIRPIRNVLDGVEGRALVTVLRRTARVHLMFGLAIGIGSAIWH